MPAIRVRTSGVEKGSAKKIHFQVELDGWKEFEAELKKMRARAKRGVMRRALLAAAERIEPEIRERAPVGETGNLKEGIKIQQNAPRLSKTKVLQESVYIVVPAEYAWPVEFGHQLFYHGRETDTFIPPDPFLREGFSASADDAAAIAYKTFDDGVLRLLQRARRKSLRQAGAQ